jgi:hypothetical protein
MKTKLTELLFYLVFAGLCVTGFIKDMPELMLISLSLYLFVLFFARDEIA